MNTVPNSPSTPPLPARCQFHPRRPGTPTLYGALPRPIGMCPDCLTKATADGLVRGPGGCAMTGEAAEIYQLGYRAGKRAGEHLAEEKAGGDYWVGYADGLLDGAGCGTEGLKTVGAYLANDDDLTAVGSA